jgi:ribonuclease HII
MNMAPAKETITKNFYEKKAWHNGLLACGIDEVGRGCLAGPLVVGAVIVPPHTSYRLLKDSKVLTLEQRLQAFDWINQHCSWAVASANHNTIDTINIYQATLAAMKQACLNLIQTMPHPREKLKYILVDAMPLHIDKKIVHECLEFHHFNYGERFSCSIAAASIVAKVTRDHLMEKLSAYFPAFGFHQHKGYATKQHINALLEQGPTFIHRHSFISKINPEVNIEETRQQGLFNENHE